MEEEPRRTPIVSEEELVQNSQKSKFLQAGSAIQYSILQKFGCLKSNRFAYSQVHKSNGMIQIRVSQLYRSSLRFGFLFSAGMKRSNYQAGYCCRVLTVLAVLTVLTPTPDTGRALSVSGFQF